MDAVCGDDDYFHWRGWLTRRCYHRPCQLQHEQVIIHAYTHMHAHTNKYECTQHVHTYDAI